jgi:hypothetical protein
MYTYTDILDNTVLYLIIVIPRSMCEFMKRDSVLIWSTNLHKVHCNASCLLSDRKLGRKGEQNIADSVQGIQREKGEFSTVLQPILCI